MPAGGSPVDRTGVPLAEERHEAYVTSRTRARALTLPPDR
jgi:hypothetical protein